MGATLGPVAVEQIRQMIRQSQFEAGLILPGQEQYQQRGLMVRLGKTDSALNKSTFASPSGGTVSIWSGGTNFASLADTGENLTAYNFWGNIASGKQVLCLRTLMGWLAIDAEC